MLIPHLQVYICSLHQIRQVSTATYKLLGQVAMDSTHHTVPVFLLPAGLSGAFSRGRVLEEGKVSNKCCLLLASKVQPQNW